MDNPVRLVNPEVNQEVKQVSSKAKTDSRGSRAAKPADASQVTSVTAWAV
jgi:hypothetical protein